MDFNSLVSKSFMSSETRTDETIPATMGTERKPFRGAFSSREQSEECAFPRWMNEENRNQNLGCRV